MRSVSLGLGANGARASGFRARRVAVAALAAPLLAVAIAGCGAGGGSDGRGHGGDAKASSHSKGGGADSGTGKGSGGTGSGGTGSGGDGVKGSGQPVLSAAQLKSALLKSGDVPGYRAQPAKKKDALAARNTVTSHNARCAPVTDALDAKPGQGRTADASGVLMKKGGLGAAGAVQQVSLAAYQDGGAARWTARLKSALKSCRSVQGSGGAGGSARVGVTPGKAPSVGDGAVRFALEGGAKGSAPVVVTVIRTGNSTATYLSIGLTGKPVPVPEAVVRKQDSKLAAAGKG